MIKTIIVDDEYPHIESLTTLLIENFKQIEIIATCDNVPDAVKKIDALKPQLVFLDIRMGKYSGFDLLEMVDERTFQVIFTTSFDKYAIQAIKVSAIDYITKPVDMDKLKDAMQLYKSAKERNDNLIENRKRSDQDQIIALPDMEGLKFIELKKIIRCESDNVYTEFYILNEKKIVVSKGIGEYEDLLESKGFFRVHKRNLVNVYNIKKYVRGEGGHLIMKDDSRHQILVARARKEDFFSYLKARKITL